MYQILIAFNKMQLRPSSLSENWAIVSTLCTLVEKCPVSWYFWLKNKGVERKPQVKNSACVLLMFYRFKNLAHQYKSMFPSLETDVEGQLKKLKVNLWHFSVKTLDWDRNKLQFIQNKSRWPNIIYSCFIFSQNY